jgi:hypothetical protein
VDTVDGKNFWFISGKGSRRGTHKACFLGNKCYHPFQYTAEISLNGFKKLKRTKVVLNFD